MHSILCLILLFCSLPYSAYSQLAVVKVPLADLSGSPLAENKENLKEQYENFPFAPDNGARSCVRVHQLKFNEIVTIVSDPTLAEVECTATNFYYLDHQHKKKSNFWMRRDNLFSLRVLTKTFDQGHLPPAVDHRKVPTDYNKNVLTLIEPWSDEKTKRRYCVGTRFARSPGDDTIDSYAVYIFDKNKNEQRVALPKAYALISYPKTKEKAVALFLRLVKRWAHLHQGIIPYVYGGCSYLYGYPEKGFEKIHRRLHKHSVTAWIRKGSFRKPFAGFDCSGLILTAAQIAGMPYYCKNTHALMEYLKPIAKDEQIENGDLIWYNHHVMIVSDVKKNLVIESVGYGAGYGKVHEIELKKLFWGIKDYKTLLQTFHGKHALMRLTRRGRLYKPIYGFKILKLKSLWQ